MSRLFSLNDTALVFVPSRTFDTCYVVSVYLYTQAVSHVSMAS